MGKRQEYVLIVWEEVPETTKLVLVPRDTLDETDMAILRTAAGAYINTDISPDQHRAVDCINAALCTKPEHLADEHPAGSKWAMRWKGHARAIDTPITDVTVTTVIVCGFLM